MPNTGRRIVTRLKEVNSVTGEEIGTTMANIAPHYIAPYIDTVLCPVEYNMKCPVKIYATRNGTKLEFEFNLPNAVAQNKDLDLLKVIAAQNGSPKTNITFSLGKNFFHGTLSGLDTSKTYTIHVEYYKGSTLKQSCYFQTEY